MSPLIARLGIAATVTVGNLASATSADVDLTGRVRVAKAGNNYAVQVDVTNDSRHRAAFGPDVYVRIKDRHGNVITEQRGRKLYQYFGGAATAPNTLNPGELGYIPLTVFSAAAVLVPGQEVRVKIAGEGASNFGSDNGNGTVCKKGTPGCP